MVKPSSRESCIINILGVGEVLFKRNYRAKRLTITVNAAQKVVVSIPGFLPVSTAKQFVEQKKGWIAERLNEVIRGNSLKHIESGYRTKGHEIIFEKSSKQKIRINIVNSVITVYYPETLTINDPNVQEFAQVAIEEAYRREAQAILPERVKGLATKFNFSYNSLKLKKTKSRWGSCSSTNNINLSIYLMKLPDDLIDYVILHELTHTVHKNHGPDFWNYLQRITGNAKTLATRVKKYRTGV